MKKFLIVCIVLSCRTLAMEHKDASDNTSIVGAVRAFIDVMWSKDNVDVIKHIEESEEAVIKSCNEVIQIFNNDMTRSIVQKELKTPTLLKKYEQKLKTLQRLSIDYEPLIISIEAMLTWLKDQSQHMYLHEALAEAHQQAQKNNRIFIGDNNLYFAQLAGQFDMQIIAVMHKQKDNSKGISIRKSRNMKKLMI